MVAITGGLGATGGISGMSGQAQPSFEAAAQKCQGGQCNKAGGESQASQMQGNGATQGKDALAQLIKQMLAELQKESEGEPMQQASAPPPPASNEQPSKLKQLLAKLDGSDGQEDLAVDGTDMASFLQQLTGAGAGQEAAAVA